MESKESIYAEALKNIAAPMPGCKERRRYRAEVLRAQRRVFGYGKPDRPAERPLPQRTAVPRQFSDEEKRAIAKRDCAYKQRAVDKQYEEYLIDSVRSLSADSFFTSPSPSLSACSSACSSAAASPLGALPSSEPDLRQPSSLRASNFVNEGTSSNTHADFDSVSSVSNRLGGSASGASSVPCPPRACACACACFPPGHELEAVAAAAAAAAAAGDVCTADTKCKAGCIRCFTFDPDFDFGFGFGFGFGFDQGANVDVDTMALDDYFNA
jgi:hypothetical protein